MASFSRRFIGAMMLQAATFEEVEHDAHATRQAAVVVLLAALSAGLSVLAVFGVRGMIRQTLIGLVAWAVSSAVLWLIGTSLTTPEDGIAIRRQILRAFDRAERERNPNRQKRLLTFVVVGGGGTGVELAGVHSTGDDPDQSDRGRGASTVNSVVGELPWVRLKGYSAWGRFRT